MTFFRLLHIFREIIEGNPSDIECESTIDVHPCDIRKRSTNDEQKLLDGETQIEYWSEEEYTKIPPSISWDVSFADSADKVW